jgi:hypothetical protein
MHVFNNPVWKYPPFETVILCKFAKFQAGEYMKLENSRKCNIFPPATTQLDLFRWKNIIYIIVSHLLKGMFHRNYQRSKMVLFWSFFRDVLAGSFLTFYSGAMFRLASALSEVSRKMDTFKKWACGCFNIICVVETGRYKYQIALSLKLQHPVVFSFFLYISCRFWQNILLS